MTFQNVRNKFGHFIIILEPSHPPPPPSSTVLCHNLTISRKERTSRLLILVYLVPSFHATKAGNAQTPTQKHHYPEFPLGQSSSPSLAPAPPPGGKDMWHHDKAPSYKSSVKIAQLYTKIWEKRIKLISSGLVFCITP